MEKDPRTIMIGDRVRALRRTGFLQGAVVRLLDAGLVPVRRERGLFETARRGDTENILSSANDYPF
jgi:hypothetical protein